MIFRSFLKKPFIMLFTIIKIVFYCFYVIFYFYDDTLYVVYNSAYEEMYIDLYNTINIYD